LGGNDAMSHAYAGWAAGTLTAAARLWPFAGKAKSFTKHIISRKTGENIVFAVFLHDFGISCVQRQVHKALRILVKQPIGIRNRCCGKHADPNKSDFVNFVGNSPHIRTLFYSPLSR